MSYSRLNIVPLTTYENNLSCHIYGHSISGCTFIKKTIDIFSIFNFSVNKKLGLERKHLSNFLYFFKLQFSISFDAHTVFHKSFISIVTFLNLKY